MTATTERTIVRAPQPDRAAQSTGVLLPRPRHEGGGPPQPSPPRPLDLPGVVARTRTLDRAGAPAAVDAIFARLSPRSRHLRFHSPVPRLPGPVRDRLVDLDGHTRAAVLAEVRTSGQWHPVGIARLAGVGDARAEVAVAVVDAWQRRGVGGRLLTLLGELAAGLGYRELCGDVLPENAAMLRLAGRLAPLGRARADDDGIRILARLGDDALTVTHEELLAGLLGR